MPKVAYEAMRFRPATLEVIEQANAIIDLYRAQGYDLTLRQLYYQFVARDLIPNSQREYSRLGDIISKGRRAGLIDWGAIVDRTRNLRSLGTWESPEDIMHAIAEQFRYDRWLTQSTYVEVWFEKDALMGVFERTANALRVPFFSCRGYTSDSEVWAAAQRLAKINSTNPRAYGIEADRRDVVVLHFGDHDPSGLDMTRDIRDRLRLFGAHRVDVRRLALNMDQIDRYQPPPNPAKDTDSRFENYQLLYGDESWELDALDPAVLDRLVRQEVATLLDTGAWNAEAEREARTRAELKTLATHYDEAIASVAEHVDEHLSTEPDEDLDDTPDDEDEE